MGSVELDIPHWHGSRQARAPLRVGGVIRDVQIGHAAVNRGRQHQVVVIPLEGPGRMDHKVNPDGTHCSLHGSAKPDQGQRRPGSAQWIRLRGCMGMHGDAWAPLYLD